MMTQEGSDTDMGDELEHNPLDVINYIRARIDGRQGELLPLQPWIKGFKGTYKEGKRRDE